MRDDRSVGAAREAPSEQARGSEGAVAAADRARPAAVFDSDDAPDNLRGTDGGIELLARVPLEAVAVARAAEATMDDDFAVVVRPGPDLAETRGGWGIEQHA